MSRKGGRGAYDEDDWRDNDDDYYSEDDDYDDGYDAYDRGGGGATFSAKAGKKKPPAAKQAAKPAALASAAQKPKEEAATATEKPQLHQSADSDSAPELKQLGGLALRDAPAAAAPYSHQKELSAALEEREISIAAGSESESGIKPELHVVVLGHVDAGKSTLVGRLLADCGVVNPRDAAKVAAAASNAGKTSFSWAWLLDATEDERQRGVTVEVGRCRVSTPKLHVTLLDAPGHADFVPEAIGGVAVADAALLVVDGSRGGFEAGFDGNKGNSSSSTTAATAGQTKEHVALARALGVRELVVAVTKLDTLGYDRNRFEEIRSRLGTFLNSLGFGASNASSSSSPPSSPLSPPRPITWLPVSAPAGQNVSAPPTEPALLSWWDGGANSSDSHPTLLAALGQLSPPERSVDSALRLPAADVSARPVRAGQACAMLSGKVESGALSRGMEVVAVPPGGGPGTGRVVSVVVRGGGGGGGNGGTTTAAAAAAPSSSGAAVAVAGDSCEVVVSGRLAEPGVLGRGAVLCPVSHPVALARKFIARIKVLDGANGGGGGGSAAAAAFAPFSSSLSSASSPGAAGIILPGSSVTLHVGAAVRPATITRLVALLDPKTGEETRKRPRLVGRGQAALVEVEPEGSGDAVAVVAVAASSSPFSSEIVSTLSRIVLREAGKTLAVGVVVEVVE